MSLILSTGDKEENVQPFSPNKGWLCCKVWNVNHFPACPLWWPCVSVLSVHHCFLSFGVFDLSLVFVVVLLWWTFLFKLFFPLCLFAWGVFPRVELQSQRLGTLISLVYISRFFHKAFWQCKSMLLFLIAPSQEVIDRLIPYFTVSHLYRLCLTSEQCQFSGTEHDNNVGLWSPTPNSPTCSCVVPGCAVQYTVTLGPGW